MKQTFTCIALLLLSVSCNNHTSQTPAATDTTITAPDSLSDLEQPAEGQEERNFMELDSPAVARLNWINNSVKRYVDSTHDKGIRIVRNDTARSIKWIWDQLEKRDGNTYVTIHLGHDEADEDGARFATDGWLYVDTLSQQVYEYDLPNDSLVLWQR